MNQTCTLIIDILKIMSPLTIEDDLLKTGLSIILDSIHSIWR